MNVRICARDPTYTFACLILFSLLYNVIFYPLFLLHVYFDFWKICDFAARISLIQQFKNVDKNTIGIQYIFPPEDVGSVCRYFTVSPLCFPPIKLLWCLSFYFMMYTTSKFLTTITSLYSFEALLNGKKIVGRVTDSSSEEFEGCQETDLLEQSMWWKEGKSKGIYKFNINMYTSLRES